MNTPDSHVPQGNHLLLDMSGVNAAPLQDTDSIEILLREAARLAGATPLSTQFHHFGKGLGVTGVVLLQESHISIHTWTEHGYAALDIFMCGDTRPEIAAQHVIERFQPQQHQLRTLIRAASKNTINIP